MARRKRADQPIGVGLTTRQAKRKKPLGLEYLVDIDPLTENQKKFFDSYAEGKHLVAYGCAGTGKTFITLYNALREVLDERTPYERIYLVRSLVQLVRLDSFLELTKTRQIFTRFLIRIWSSICFRCLLMPTLRCFMEISNHKKPLSSGRPHLFVEQLLIMLLLL
jgi:hypothetical protein